MSKIQYQLTALEKFVCTGSNCPANCCRANWKIGLEPEIFQQWQSLPDKQECTRLSAAVDSYVEDGKEVLKMKLDEEGSCVLQTEDHLCSLQQKHGHSLLPLICQTYPRVSDATGVHALSSLHLSCPEVARTVLFNNTVQVFQKRSSGQVHLLTAEDQLRYTLTELLDRVMAEAKISLAARVFYLADVIVKLSHQSMQPGVHAGGFQKLVANSKNELYQIGLGIKTGRLRPSPVVAGSFWRAILSIGRGMQLLPELETSSALVMQLTGDPALRDEQCAAIHMEIQRLRHATQDHWRAYDVHFLRYLHASLMFNGFPWNPEFNNYIAALMRAMLPFALARLRLWLLADKQGTLEDQDVMEIVYTTERAISHQNLVTNVLNRTPALLELEQYHTAFLML